MKLFIKERNDKMIEVYTDGAASNNGKEDAVGGAAWVILKDGEKIAEGMRKIFPATNNICELVGVVEGCLAAEAILKENNTTDLSFKPAVVVHSDSAYIINCWKEKWYQNWERNNWKNSKKKPVANKELWQALLPFFKNRHFIFNKVAGHAGIKWNEYVDTKAVEAKEL
jgi:ribonuclease HI